MAEVGTAYLTIIPEMSGVSSRITSMLGGVDTSGVGSKWGSSAGNGFAGSLLGSGAIIGAASAVASKAFDAIGSSIGSAVSRVDTMANFPKVMQNLGYSADDAATSISTMSSRIDGLPTSLDSITGVVQQLAPLTGNLGSATTIGLSFNDMLLASGKSTADQSRAMEQYTQMLSKGTVDLQSWRTLQEVMPGQLDQVSTALLGAGNNSQDLYTALQNGTVSMGDFNNAIVDLDSNGANGFASFAQQAKDATGGIGTAMENVQNRIAKAMAKIIDSIGQTNISGAINSFSSSFSGIADVVISAMGGISDGFAATGVADKVNALISSIQPLMPTFDQVKGAAKALGDFLGTVLGGYIDTLVSCWQGLTDAFSSSTFQDALSSLSTAFGSIQTALSGVQPMFDQFLSISRDFGQGVGMVLANVMQAVANAIGAPEFQSALSNVSTEFGNLMSAVQPFLDNVLFPLANTVLPFLATGVTQLVGTILNIIGAIAQVFADALNFMTWLSTVPGQIGTFLSGIPDAIGGFFSQAASSSMAFLQPLLDWFGSLPGNIVGFITGIPGAIGDLFSQACSSSVDFMQPLLDFFSNLPQNIGDFISSIPGKFADMFSQIHVPSLHVDGGFNLDPANFSIPSISFYANGGIVTKPTLGMVGEAGEAEAITPISKLMPMISQAVAGTARNTSDSAIAELVGLLRDLRDKGVSANIDGKSASKILTPYVNQDLALAVARR